MSLKTRFQDLLKQVREALNMPGKEPNVEYIIDPNRLDFLQPNYSVEGYGPPTPMNQNTKGN